jgi:hypothetical protein
MVFLVIIKLELKGQISIKPHSQLGWGTFSYEQMPFGLSNAGATFQRAMQIDFDDLIGKIIQIYLDDLTVYSKTHHIILIILKSLFTMQKIWHIFKSFEIYFWCHSR